ncbi:uncharacterized protein LOC129296048 [Prosopis cineraria]|uniref:uncharacterized protein LOC129296048 n=1 Tax=Prosopis cineraria TaxID=364024 RepID=UPI00240FED15|nr:uncharacterized protein LOC129296048 [Prosopis cineraria]
MDLTSVTHTARLNWGVTSLLFTLMLILRIPIPSGFGFSGFFFFFFCKISSFSLIPLTNSLLQAQPSLSSIFVYMPKEKSPGLKILWIWTIGTAAILVTSVVRTRLRDLQNAMNADHQHHQQQQQNHEASLGSAVVDTFPSSEESKPDDKV